MTDTRLTISLFLIALTAVLLIGTETKVTWIDDEVTILDVAQTSVTQTLGRFSNGLGQHEHPPLSDIILHYWSSYVSTHLSLLRVLNILLYCLGGSFLVRAAMSSAIPNADICVAILFLSSPFGYHFGRMFGWYSFSFAAISALTYFLIKSIAGPLKRNYILGLTVAGTVLVYVNYLGWAVVGLAACIYFLSAPSKLVAVKISALWLGATSVLYLPMWRVMLHQIPLSVHTSSSILSRAANMAYALNVLVASEAVAPWAGWIGPTLSLLIATLIVSLACTKCRLARNVFGGSALLVLAMSVSGSLLTKRLIIAYPWFLFALGLLLANSFRVKKFAVVALITTIISFAWFGVVTRRYYSAFHSIEPWRNEAAAAAEKLRRNSMVVTNSEVLLFYLTYAIQDSELPHLPFNGLIGSDIHAPGVAFVSGFDTTLVGGRKVLFVEGVNRDFMSQSSSTLAWLNANCKGLSTEKELQDGGFELKKKLFPDAGQVQFRIIKYNFDCSSPVVLANQAPALPILERISRR